MSEQQCQTCEGSGRCPDCDAMLSTICKPIIDSACVRIGDLETVLREILTALRSGRAIDARAIEQVLNPIHAMDRALKGNDNER